MANILQRTERFETHHRILFFVIVLLGMIVVTRIGVVIHNPNPVFLGLQLHHFDYGIILLIIGAQLSLFGPRKFHFLYMILIAVASGMVIDEYWMIRHGVAHAATPMQEYNSTILSVIILASITILTTLFLNSLAKRRAKR